MMTGFASTTVEASAPTHTKDFEDFALLYQTPSDGLLLVGHYPTKRAAQNALARHARGAGAAPMVILPALRR